MSVESSPAKMHRLSSIRLHRLKEIADVLGVSVDALTASAQPHILHTDEDGTCWFLTTDTQGVPVVRCTRGSAAGQGATEESILSVLMRDIGSPQHQALVALIDRLLAMHLAR